MTLGDPRPRVLAHVPIVEYRDTVLTATPARSATVAMFGFRFILVNQRVILSGKHRRHPCLDPDQHSCCV